MANPQMGQISTPFQLQGILSLTDILELKRLP